MPFENAGTSFAIDKYVSKAGTHRVPKVKFKWQLFQLCNTVRYGFVFKWLPVVKCVSLLVSLDLGSRCCCSNYRSCSYVRRWLVWSCQVAYQPIHLASNGNNTSILFLFMSLAAKINSSRSMYDANDSVFGSNSPIVPIGDMSQSRLNFWRGTHGWSVLPSIAVKELLP